MNTFKFEICQGQNELNLILACLQKIKRQQGCEKAYRVRTNVVETVL